MTASINESFLASSHIRQITLRSRYKSFFVQNNSNSLSGRRVLLATIRDKGLCPCPRCLIPKKDFYLLGLLTDLSQRMSRARLYLRDKVSAACNAIYNLGSPIKGTLPEGHLRDMSLVPMFVSPFEFLDMHARASLTVSLHRMQLQITSDHWVVMSTACSLLISFMNLN